MHDIAPELERLRAKAVTKSRDLLMARSAGRPLTLNTYNHAQRLDLLCPSSAVSPIN